MPAPSRPHPFTVVYDPDATVELATAVKSKEERNDLQRRRQVAPARRAARAAAHEAAAAAGGGLRELRPRQGRSDWRALYARRGDVYVVLAFDRHANFDALVARAQTRAAQYAELTDR